MHAVVVIKINDALIRIKDMIKLFCWFFSLIQEIAKMILSIRI